MGEYVWCTNNGSSNNICIPDVVIQFWLDIPPNYSHPCSGKRTNYIGNRTGHVDG